MARGAAAVEADTDADADIEGYALAEEDGTVVDCRGDCRSTPQLETTTDVTAPDQPHSVRQRMASEVGPAPSGCHAENIALDSVESRC